MSLLPAEKRRIALRTTIGTLSGLSWCLALVSGLSTYEGVWRILGATQSCMVDAGLAGRGHCWLCGMSHAFRALWQGRFAAALVYNPNSIALFSVMLLACASVMLLWLPFKRKEQRIFAPQN